MVLSSVVTVEKKHSVDVTELSYIDYGFTLPLQINGSSLEKCFDFMGQRDIL